MKVYAQPVGFALLSLTERQKAWGIGYQTNLVKFNPLKTKDKQTNTQKPGAFLREPSARRFLWHDL